MKIVRIDRLTPTGGTDSPDIGGAGAAPFFVDVDTPLKKCCGCKQFKPLDDFFKETKGKYGRSGYCKVCKKQRSVLWHQNLKDNPREFIQVDSKVCSVCGLHKQAEKFYHSYATPDGLTSFCRVCSDVRSTAWGKNNKEAKNGYDTIRRSQVRADVLNAYGGHCVCCGETLQELLNIDHIKGGGHQHCKSLGIEGYAFYLWLWTNGFPQDDYRVLCQNCNFSIGQYGYCPHNSPSSFDDLSALTAGVRSTRKLKRQVMAGYGGCCQCCGNAFIEHLSIDHIHGGGGEERRTDKTKPNHALYRYLRDNGFPTDKYRCLCMSCNASLGLYGYCPHTRQREELVS